MHLVHDQWFPPLRSKKTINWIKHVIFSSEQYLHAKLYGFVVRKRFPPHVKTMIACRICHAISMPARVNAHSLPSRSILGRVHTYILLLFWQISSARWGLIVSSCSGMCCSLIGWWKECECSMCVWVFMYACEIERWERRRWLIA